MSNVVEIPALIDMHSHLREPGFEEKETVRTGSLSAQRGGFGIVCAMANTDPICFDPQTLDFIKSLPSAIRVLQVASVTKDLKDGELVDFKELKAHGAIAFSNDGYPITNKKVFENALKSGELILSHLENEASEAAWQIEVFEKLVLLGFSPRLHFCHISKAETIEIIRKAKRKKLNITAETAPHYFTFTSRDITKTGIFKMNPPLGDENDRNAVIEGLLDGTLDVIATDHAPHTNKEKLLPLKTSPNGITGFETALAVGLKLFDIDFLVRKMAKNPQKILRIDNNKKIKVDLDEIWTFKAAESLSKCKVSPYDGMTFKGRVIKYAY